MPNRAQIKQAHNHRRSSFESIRGTQTLIQSRDGQSPETNGQSPRSPNQRIFLLSTFLLSIGSAMAIRGQTSEQPRSNPIQTNLYISRETQWYGARREAKQCRSQTQIARGEIRAEKEALQSVLQGSGAS